MKKYLLPLITLGFSCLASCQETPVKPVAAHWGAVTKAWSGAAEISSYDLTQVRYGKAREGSAVLIYVREPFLRDRQVKDESGSGDFQVLKLNVLKEFKTGIYPYRAMTSIFHPLENSPENKALKVTTSIQEWCGHTYMHTSRKDKSIQIKLNSYFEKEEGETFKTKASVLLEDEVWTMLRVQPELLPTGKVEIIEGNLASRFSHSKQKVSSAQASWLKGSSDATRVYQIQFQDTGRSLSIETSKAVPYHIQGWQEIDRNGDLISAGKLKKRLENIPYWKFTDEEKGSKLRKQLGLK